jgi:hypothetical protein
MSTQRKGYPALIIRSSLLIGYLFLFVSQSNYQYFDTANFFVYQSDAVTTANTGVASRPHTAATAIAPRQQAPQHTLTLLVRHQRIGHLAIDKRYHSQQGLRIPPIRAPGVIFSAIIRAPFYTCAPAYSSANLPANFLRGPPCAA